MSTNTNKNEKMLEGLILAALRAEGLLFPTTEEEVERFLKQVEAKPIPPDLQERAILHALGKTDCRKESISRQAVSVREKTSKQNILEEELVALHRKEGEMPKEIARKLAGIRKRV